MTTHTKATSPEDERQRGALMSELERDVFVDASQLDCVVKAGVATLVGTVSSVAEKMTILRTIENMDGVQDVISEIEVKVQHPAKRSDEQLDRMVRSVLDWDALVPELSLTVSVTDAWVTLEGEVPTGRQRHEAERAVNHLLGIRGVTNAITVSQPDISLATLRHAIETALRRRAVHRARQIGVSVDESTVTLRGKVQSADERRALLGAVTHVKGVDSVCDELVLVDH